MAPTVALAVLAEWVGLSNKAFAVTPKGVSTDRLNFRLSIAAPHIVLLLLSIAALLNAWWWSADRYSVDSLFVTTFWTLYNIVGLAMAVLVCLERPRRRSTERTEVEVSAEAAFWQGGSRDGVVLDLSAGGARVLVPWPSDGDRRFALEPPREKKVLSIEDVGAVRGVTRWVAEVENGLVFGFEFTELTAAHSIGIMRHVTDSPDWVRHDREEGARLLPAMSRTIVGAVRRVRPNVRNDARIGTRGVARLTHGDRTLDAHIEDLSFGGCRIHTRAVLDTGDRVTIDIADLSPSQRVASVRWVERRGSRTIAGLRFESARTEEHLVS